MYAPIIVFCYNRKEHLEKTLYALEQNRLANQSEIYIFADGSRGEKDKEAVEEVRDYLKVYRTKTCFKTIEVIESEKNKGLANSIIEGVSRIIEKYGKVIVVEDDLVTSADFLEYMNQTLDFYEEDEKIWSVTGYTLPLKGLKTYKEACDATSNQIYALLLAVNQGWKTKVSKYTQTEQEAAKSLTDVQSILNGLEK